VDTRGIVDWLLNIAEHYPDTVCLLLGSIAAFTLTAMLERYFLPPTVDPVALRRQQGFTFLFCWLASGVISSALWTVVDPADPLRMRLVVSFTVGILPFPTYPILSRLAAAHFKAFSTAWINPPAGPPA